MSSRRPPRTALVGAGRLARAFKPLLTAKGYRPRTVSSREPRLPRDARLLLLAVPDRAIEEVAGRLARLEREDWSGCVALHHSGALGTGPLRPLAAQGAAVGVLHPLQCLGGGKGASALLRGSRARIEGDRAARTVARKLASDLGLVPIRFPRELDDDARVAYHAAGGLVANDLVALVSIAVDLLASTGLEPREAIRALAPLIRGTTEQLERHGPGGALTGPVPRGDDETLRRHLRRLARSSPEHAEIHRLLSRRLARVARAEGALDETSLRRLLRRIGPPGKPGL